MKHYINTAVFIVVLSTLLIFIEEPIQKLLVALIVVVIHLIVTAIGVSNIRLNYFLQSVNSSKPNTIAFSFDDSPCKADKKVLDLLKNEGIQAMFFVIGKLIEQDKDILERIHNEGHLIGNHSFSHENNIGWASTRKVQGEIQKCNDAIQQSIGLKPTFYRPPFGIVNPNIARAIKREGMTSVGWNLRTFDTTDRSKENLLKRIKSRMNNRGQIILFHSSGHHTLDLLKETIDHARKNGIEIANFSDVLTDN